MFSFKLEHTHEHSRRKLERVSELVNVYHS